MNEMTAHLEGAPVAFVTELGTAEALAAAQSAWLGARDPHQQTSVFSFGNFVVDDLEGKVNAWPLDEGLIDYMDASYGGSTNENEAAVLNVIANSSFTLFGDTGVLTDLVAEKPVQQTPGKHTHR